MFILKDGEVLNTLVLEQWIRYLKSQCHAECGQPHAYGNAKIFQSMLRSARAALRRRQDLEKRRKRRRKELARLQSNEMTLRARIEEIRSSVRVRDYFS